MQGPTDFRDSANTSSSLPIGFNTPPAMEKSQQKGAAQTSGNLTNIINKTLNNADNKPVSSLKNGDYRASQGMEDTGEITHKALSTLHDLGEKLEPKGIPLAHEQRLASTQLESKVLSVEHEEVESFNEEQDVTLEKETASEPDYDFDTDDDNPNFDSFEDFSDTPSLPASTVDEREEKSEHSVKEGKSPPSEDDYEFDTDDDNPDFDSFEAEDTSLSNSSAKEQEALEQAVDKVSKNTEPVRLRDLSSLRTDSSTVKKKEDVRSHTIEHLDTYDLGIDGSDLRDALRQGLVKALIINNLASCESISLDHVKNADALINTLTNRIMIRNFNANIDYRSIISRHIEGDINRFEIHALDERSWNKVTSFVHDTYQSLKQLEQMKKNENREDAETSLVQNAKIKKNEDKKEEKKMSPKKRSRPDDIGKTVAEEEIKKTAQKKDYDLKLNEMKKKEINKKRHKHIQKSDENRRQLESENIDKARKDK